MPTTICAALRSAALRLSAAALLSAPLAASAALLGVAPGLPLTNFNSTGVTSYDAADGTFEITAAPISTLFPPVRLVAAPKSVTVRIVVDGAGNVVGGIPGDDLVLSGAVDTTGDGVNDASGVLLTGEISAFGFNDSGGPTDTFDFRFVVTGGALAPFFAGKDIGVTLTSEGSSFVGDFGANFAGGAKGNIGPIPPLPRIRIKKQVSIESLPDLQADNKLFIADDPNVDPDGGVWFDADTFGTGPSVGEVGASYRLIVTNPGAVPVTNAQIADLIEGEPLGNPAFANIALGTLAPGESRIIVSSVITENMLTINPDATSSLSSLDGVDLLDRPDRCEDFDVIDNDNPANKLLNVARVTADGDLSDENPAWVMCVPQLIIKKQVSVQPLATLAANNLLFVSDDPLVDPDAGVWFDADTFSTGPSTALNATYRLIVTNTGNTVVTNAQITDLIEGEPLGAPAFADVGLGDLQPGESRIIVSSEVASNMLTINPDMSSSLSPLAGVDLLDRPDRCDDFDVVDVDNPATKLLNVARVTADGGLQDENPAWVMCVEPELLIKKQVSIEPLADLELAGLLFVPDDPNVDPDEGVWFDADTFGTGPTADLAATYRLILANVGTVAVTNVQISDFLAANEPLGNPAFTNIAIGTLEPGEVRVIVSSVINENMATFDPNSPPAFSHLDGVGLLDRPDRCADEDVVNDDNPATKLLNVARVTADGDLSDEDPAWVMCTPEIVIKKQVSVEPLQFLVDNNLLFVPDTGADPDGGVWFDADTFAAGPSTGLGATYRLILTNTGNSPVTNAQISDFLTAEEPLGNPAFTDVSLGNLQPGESRIIVTSKVADNMLTINPDSSTVLGTLPGVSLLDRPDRCLDTDVVTNDNPATKLLNIARVRADGDISDEDPAWVMCTPELVFKKQVSVQTLQFLTDNGLLFAPDTAADPDSGVWFDADTFGSGPTTALNATYRLIVTNTGNIPVTNAQITDLMEGEPLGNPAFANVDLGDLQPGESRIIVSSQVAQNMLTINPDLTSFLGTLAGVDLLDRPDRCLDTDVVNNDNPAAKLLNIARVTADGDIVEENPAWVMCQQECDLRVTKTCVIPQPPRNTLLGKCSGKIQQWTVVWNGAQPITISGLPNNAPGGVVGIGQEVIFTNPGGGENDVFVNISGGVNGQSKFHLSCSDRDMNADNDNDVQSQLPGRSQDCGKDAGDGKSTSGFINDWIFEGLVDADGLELDCTPSDPVPTEAEQCEFTPAPSAASCSDVKPVDGLTMVWNGSVDVDIVAYDGAVGGTVLAEFDGVKPGDVVTVTGMGGSPNDQQWDIFLAGTDTKLGNSEFHISCSDADMNGPEDCPLPQGNGKSDSSSLVNTWGFGGILGTSNSFTCPGVPGLSDSAEVVFGFEVENLNNEAITVQIVDGQLGINQSETIAANSTLAVVTDPVTITPDGTGTDPFDPDVFKNTVTVTGTTASGAMCEAMDMVKVKRSTPPPPPVSCSDIKPITGVSVVWNGTETVDVVMESGELFESVQPGNTITFQEAGTGNDVEMTITRSSDGAPVGASKFHVSCSDSGMNGSEDCGTAQGNGKNDESGLVNDWLLDGMIGEKGSFACNVSNTGTVDPTPGGGGGPGGGAVSGAASLDLGDGKKVKWELTNSGSSDVFITRVEISWPSQHGQVKKFRLDGDFAKDVFDGTSPTAVPDEKGFESDANKRKLKKGDSKKLEVEFTESFGGHTQGQFTISVEFDSGQVVTFP